MGVFKLKRKKLALFLSRLEQAYDSNPKARRAVHRLQDSLERKNAPVALIEAEVLAEALLESQ